jgi:hypothetical protein
VDKKMTHVPAGMVTFHHATQNGAQFKTRGFLEFSIQYFWMEAGCRKVKQQIGKGWTNAASHEEGRGAVNTL